MIANEVSARWVDSLDMHENAILSKRKTEYRSRKSWVHSNVKITVVIKKDALKNPYQYNY